MGRTARAAAGVGAIGAVVAIVWFARPPAPPEAPVGSVTVAIHGARLVDRGIPRFDGERRPILLVDGVGAPPPLTAALEADGATTPLSVRPFPIDGGWRFETRLAGEPPPPGPTTLRVRVGPATAAERAITWATAPEALPALAPVARARASGDAAAAQAALRALEQRRETLDAEARLWLPVERTRVALLGGDLPAARAAWLDGARLAGARGLAGERARRLNAAAYIALNQRDFVAMDRLTRQAEALLDRLDEPSNHANVLHMRGVLALETGDWRAADARFEAALALAERVGLHRVRRLIVESRALALGALGRHDEALASLDAVRNALPDLPPVDRSRFHVNAGWLWLGAGDPERAAAAFATALDDADRPTRRANIRLNQAEAALALGDVSGARRHLDAALADGAADSHGLAVDMLEARLARASGEDRAAALFEAVEGRARRELGSDGGDVAWRALHGRGQAIRGVDRAASAALFERALADMTRQGARTGLLGPRGTYFAARRALVADAVALALERERPSEAFGIADRDRARVLRAGRTRMRVQRLNASERSRWLERAGALAAARDRLAELRSRADLVAGDARSLWATELRAAEGARRDAFEQAVALLDRVAPVEADADGADAERVAAALAPDTWLVATSPEGAGWRSFRVTSEGIDHHPVGDDPLSPWRGALDQPGGPLHLYLVSGGHPRGFAAATEAYDGRPPLMVTHSVSWLPFAGLLLRPSPAAAGPPVIVADPGLDLPHARAAGRSLAERWPDADLLVGDAATAEAVGATLRQTRLLHFSGHGVLRHTRPWDAHLRLAGGRRFDVVDILGHRMDGGRVVLNGCHTGPEGLLLRDDVLGLPEAFLAAGATSVVATDRPVPDAAARAFTEAFYAAGGLTDPAGALRTVAAQGYAAGHPTWSAWRLLGVR